MKGLSGVLVPKDKGLALVSDANGAYLRDVEALVLELLNGLLDACLDSLEELKRVVFMPAEGGQSWSWPHRPCRIF